MEYSVALMAGLCCFVIGLSLILKSQDWAVFYDNIQKAGRRGSLSTGIMALLVGTFIVSFHWNWSGLASVLTLVGILSIAKGSFFLLFPSWLPRFLSHYQNTGMELILRISGGLTTLLSFVFLTEWWMGLNEMPFSP